MSKLTEQQLHEIVDSLSGTCLSIDAILEPMGLEFEDLTIEDTDFIRQWIFNCDQCGWWCDASEEVADEICADCWEKFDGFE